ncbi:MAG: hypothetical protein K2Z81_15530 [Cyanobacteria bacterium]|nr:hypothetical protein [Cyanobacteriota bacterium]
MPVHELNPNLRQQQSNSLQRAADQLKDQIDDLFEESSANGKAKDWLMNFKNDALTATPDQRTHSFTQVTNTLCHYLRAATDDCVSPNSHSAMLKPSISLGLAKSRGRNYQ